MYNVLRMEKSVSTLDILEKYQKEIAEFLKFDELNMKDVQMSLPSVRHYWVGRLMFHKQRIKKLERGKKVVYQSLKEKVENSSPVHIKNVEMNKAIVSHEAYLKIEEEIANEEIIVEFLTKVELNFRDTQYGLSNLVKIIALETT